MQLSSLLEFDAFVMFVVFVAFVELKRIKDKDKRIKANGREAGY